VIISDVTHIDQLDFGRSDHLLPVVTQHAHTGEVLMLAYVNRAALERTIERGEMWYFSRSRGELWHKGETSGSVQRVVSLHADCDRDTLLARVLPAGPACHTGAANCFDTAPTLAELDGVIGARTESAPASSYTGRLLADSNLRLKKLGEEAVELALACEREDRERIAGEAADLLYHVLVACRAAGVSAADVLAELASRATGAAGAPETADTA
jgi:phosphoribosyl-ATP pyrophosphohydrolase/phosphoribosyl-AMP cyclohydrolase